MLKVDHDWFLPILQFAVPIMFLGYLAFSIRTGEIHIRGITVYRKDEEPEMFWFCAGLLGAIGFIWLAAAIYQLFSNPRHSLSFFGWSTERLRLWPVFSMYPAFRKSWSVTRICRVKSESGLAVRPGPAPLSFMA